MVHVRRAQFNLRWNILNARLLPQLRAEGRLVVCAASTAGIWKSAENREPYMLVADGGVRDTPIRGTHRSARFRIIWGGNARAATRFGSRAAPVERVATGRASIKRRVAACAFASAQKEGQVSCIVQYALSSTEWRPRQSCRTSPVITRDGRNHRTVALRPRISTGAGSRSQGLQVWRAVRGRALQVMQQGAATMRERMTRSAALAMEQGQERRSQDGSNGAADVIEWLARKQSALDGDPARAPAILPIASRAGRSVAAFTP